MFAIDRLGSLGDCNSLNDVARDTRGAEDYSVPPNRGQRAGPGVLCFAMPRAAAQYWILPADYYVLPNGGPGMPAAHRRRLKQRIGAAWSRNPSQLFEVEKP